ncbi:MAG: hypothetical protein WCQ21_15505 [Verrucomicrobiota bacterium]
MPTLFVSLDSLRKRLHWLLVLLATSGGTLGTATTSNAALAGATPWAVIKCKFSDQLQEPVFDPAFLTGTNGMAGYWNNVSYGQISLNGTTINGWYNLPITLADAQAIPVATRRQQIINACIAAATDIDVSKYYGVIALVNAVIDSGAARTGAPGRVLLDPYAWNVTFAAHEMGHGYGLNHSWLAAPPTQYGNPWDIMSAMNVDAFHGGFGRPASDYAAVGLAPPPGDGYPSGPGLNAPNLDKFGWLAANRIAAWNGGSQTVTLAALNHPEAAGYFMCKVPFDPIDPNHYYTVEFRRKTGWDVGIPRDTVMINEVRQDGLFYLINIDGGPERLSNQTFHDLQNNLDITVLNIDSASSTATVNIGRNVVWVDFNYLGQSQLGTYDLPYATLAQGLNAVAYDGTVKIKAGSTTSTASISRKMRIEAYGGLVTIGK